MGVLYFDIFSIEFGVNPEIKKEEKDLLKLKTDDENKY